MEFLPRNVLGRNCMALSTISRAATAAMAAKVWSLSRFWVSIRSYKKQLVKKFWTLPGSNLPWRPCYGRARVAVTAQMICYIHCMINQMMSNTSYHLYRWFCEIRMGAKQISMTQHGQQTSLHT